MTIGVCSVGDNGTTQTCYQLQLQLCPWTVQVRGIQVAVRNCYSNNQEIYIIPDKQYPQLT